MASLKVQGEILEDFREMDRVSPSEILMFNSCQAKWWLTYRINERLEGSGPSVAGIAGTIIHAILESVYQIENPSERAGELDKIANKAMKDVFAVLNEGKVLWLPKRFRTELKELYDNCNGKGHAVNVAKVIRKRIDEQAANLLDFEDPEDVEVFFSERTMETHLNGVDVRGIIDRYAVRNGDPAIQDWKTGKLWGESELTEDSIGVLPIKIYSLIVDKEATGDIPRPSKAQLIFLGHHHVLSIDVTEEKLEEWEAEVVEFIEDMNSVVKKKKVKLPKEELDSCRWCEFKEKCPTITQEKGSLVDMFKAAKDSS